MKYNIKVHLPLLILGNMIFIMGLIVTVETVQILLFSISIIIFSYSVATVLFLAIKLIAKEED